MDLPLAHDYRVSNVAFRQDLPHGELQDHLVATQNAWPSAALLDGLCNRLLPIKVKLRGLAGIPLETKAPRPNVFGGSRISIVRSVKRPSSGHERAAGATLASPSIWEPVLATRPSWSRRSRVQTAPSDTNGRLFSVKRLEDDSPPRLSLSSRMWPRSICR